MSTHAATSGAIALSGGTLLLCLVALFAVYNEMQDIWGELDAEMGQFRVGGTGQKWLYVKRIITYQLIHLGRNFRPKLLKKFKNYENHFS